MRTIKKGATSQSVYFEVLDSTSTTGGRKTGLVFNTSGLSAYYDRNQAASVAITLATLAAASSAWSSGGFKEVDATNMPGLYRLDVPDAAFATGAESVVVTIRGATGMAQGSTEVQLNDNTSADIYSRLGAPAGASVSADVAALPTTTTVNAIKSQTDKFAFTVANQVDANVLDWKSATAPAMTGDAFARLGAPAGASTAADVAAIKGALPAALVGGRIDANIGSVTAAAITAAAFAASALDAVWSTASRLLTAGTNIVLAKGTGITGFNDLDAAGVRTATGLASANLDTQLSGINAKTTNLPAAPADESLIIAATNSLATSIAGIPSANANADALLDRAAGVETGWTLRQAMRIVLSVLSGKASGLDTTTAVYRDMADTKNRISATVDVNGNRTAVTRDAS